MKTGLAGFAISSLLARVFSLIFLAFAAPMPAFAADRMMEPPGGSLDDVQARMFAGVPDTYSGAEIRGRIVNAENGEPIEGAVVVAGWQISKTIITPDFPFFWTTRRSRVLHVAEALSDREGRYVMPAWGPIERPADWRREGPFDPQLAIFKPGYEPDYPNNMMKENGQSSAKPFNPITASLLRSMHDGEDIALCQYGKCDSRRLIPMSPNPHEKRTPEQISQAKVGLFISHLWGNVSNADESNARGDSPLRLDAIRRQCRAIMMAHEEWRKVGEMETPPAWQKTCFPWCGLSHETRKFVEVECSKK